MTNLVSASAEILVIRKVKFCAFCCGSRFGDDFVECIVRGGGRAKEQKNEQKRNSKGIRHRRDRNKKRTEKEQ